MEISFLDNPSVEAAEDTLVVKNKSFSLILNPTTLSMGLIKEAHDIARKYVNRVDLSKFRSICALGAVALTISKAKGY